MSISVPEPEINVKKKPTFISKSCIILVGFVVLILVVYESLQSNIRCVIEPVSLLLTKTNPVMTQNFNIFFIESNMNRSVLSLRQTCAIESAARHNPDANVYLYTLRAHVNSSLSVPLFSKYPNLRLIDFRPEEFFQNDTNLVGFWKNGSMMNSIYAPAHLSDFLRLLLLYKNGGIYSDLDTITLKSFRPLIDSNKNGFGYLYEYYDALGTGFIIFPRKNHPFLNSTINTFINSYDPNAWSRNGPVLIVNQILYFCWLYSFLELELVGFKFSAFNNQPAHSCSDLVIFPEWYFYPLTYLNNEFELVFSNNTKVHDMLNTKLRGAYSMHYYNKLSSKLTAPVKQESFFVRKAAENCPVTYEFAKMYNLDF